MTDRLTVLVVVAILGAIALTGILGTVFLIANGSSGDQVAVVVSLTGPATGALAAILARTESTPTQQAPQPSKESAP